MFAAEKLSLQRATIGLVLSLLMSSAALAQTPAASAAAAPIPAPTVPFVDPATPPAASQSPFIGGVKLHVTDLEKAIKFYETVFGMKYFNNNLAGSTRQVMLGFPNLQASAGQPAGTWAEPIIVLMHDPNFVHVDTNMADFFVRAPDPAVIKKKAQDAGYTVPTTGNILTDPSGNKIEVAVIHYFKTAP